jgi:hypothetical protein
MLVPVLVRGLASDVSVLAMLAAALPLTAKVLWMWENLRCSRSTCEKAQIKKYHFTMFIQETCSRMVVGYGCYGCKMLLQCSPAFACFCFEGEEYCTLKLVSGWL